MAAAVREVRQPTPVRKLVGAVWYQLLARRLLVGASVGRAWMGLLAFAAHPIRREVPRGGRFP